MKYALLFFPSGHGNESYNLIGSYHGPDFPISYHSHSNACVSIFSVSFFRLRAWKEINKLFTGLGSVRIVKNCDLRLENAALGLLPQAPFTRPRSQFFTILTSQRAKNIYVSNQWPIEYRYFLGSTGSESSI